MMSPQLALEVKPLTIEHVPEILALQDLIIETLSDKKSYYREENDYFFKALQGGDYSLGLFDRGNLVGYNIVSLPDDIQNLGYEVGLYESALSKVAHWGPAAIHPSLQGNGLLKKILVKQLKELKVSGYEHIFLTIAPCNYSSLAAVLQQGFLIKRIKLKFGNLLRYILHLDMSRTLKKPICQVRVTGEDLESQKLLLTFGFYGYSVESEKSGTTTLLFGHDGLEETL
ncbi:GNAT family N-acetyltransferase [Propionispora hippei]|uniref:N-acetyltransferase domain-containing protein n=1 Tax=Propionispora hippei DSM 15287 TaxID=1123003 RepID=A0A1M6EGV7_9FIRM|nr:GNAT family N-acetyltransferase [Propionispora hippei]SHI84663.1 hypothetical protein SAMN02745170_01188 [Propionispora hippei DSM 15287]